MEKNCTIQEAITEINKKRQVIFINCEVKMPVSQTGDLMTFFPGLGSVKVDRKTAIRFVKEILKNFESRGARIRLHRTEPFAYDKATCLFIG
jgi:hypothetical protein